MKPFLIQQQIDTDTWVTMHMISMEFRTRKEAEDWAKEHCEEGTWRAVQANVVVRRDQIGGWIWDYEYEGYTQLSG